jgi:hypothetical protein
VNGIMLAQTLIERVGIGEYGGIEELKEAQAGGTGAVCRYGHGAGTSKRFQFCGRRV